MVSVVCDHGFTYVAELLRVVIIIIIIIQPLIRDDPYMTQNMLRSFKTTTCLYLTNKAGEADSVSSQLTASPPPPLLPLLLFHCVNMTEPPLVI